MIEFLRSWVMTIITIVMFIVLLEIVLPSGKTKKVVNMVSGFILVITMINPVVGLFGKSIEFKGFNVEDQNFLDRESIETHSTILNDKQTAQILEVYRRNITIRLKELCEKEKDIIFIRAEIQLAEDRLLQTFGEIKRVYLDIAPASNEQKEILPVKPIQEVRIGENAEKELNSVKGSRLVSRMEELVAGAFGIQKDKVVISVLEM